MHCRFTPESLHWLITNKKKKGVSKYIRTSSRFNRVEIPLHECKSTSNLEAEGKKRTFFDIFKSPALVIHLLLNAYILIVMNGTYWALSLFSTELSEDKMTGFFLSGLVEIPAGLLAIGLLIYLDRKTVSFLSLTLQALSMLCALYLPVGPQVSMVFPLLAKVFNTIVWCSQPLLYTESTPTSVRNVFCGVAGFMGDLGSVVAPYLKRLEAIHKSAPALVIVVMSLISAMIVLIMPETKDKKLPEDLEDFDPGPLFRWMKKRSKAEQSMEEAKTFERVLNGHFSYTNIVSSFKRNNV
ncbi:hypothetical protein Y032_0015g2566 [Ancylostoma ceylanicum]|uniref:Major facilitator superfamily (MFS) profile domain-containing protein n=1 Tax=Ancylostoma ceylanicum TaxID=53326 RepID=A0A016V7L7_9BILA|nr:hypothetical protein Y032_0015g2566 [Ancylostoma ceylanicum]